MAILEALIRHVHRWLYRRGHTDIGDAVLQSIQEHPELWSIERYHARRPPLVLWVANGDWGLSVECPFKYELKRAERRLIWQALDVVRVRQIQRTK